MKSKLDVIIQDLKNYSQKAKDLGAVYCYIPNEVVKDIVSKLQALNNDN